ncbi:MAG: hypothetical protein ACE5GM_01015 [bacterium]
MDSFLWLFTLLAFIAFMIVRRDPKDWEQVKSTLTHPHQSCFVPYEHPPHGH